MLSRLLFPFTRPTPPHPTPPHPTPPYPTPPIAIPPQDKLAELLEEIRRCVAERQQRLNAFLQCEKLRQLTHHLWQAALDSTEDVSGVGLSRSSFLNLHLSLARGGYFARPRAVGEPPYCYVAPPYVFKCGGDDPPEVSLKYDENDEGVHSRRFTIAPSARGSLPCLAVTLREATGLVLIGARARA